jgi:tripartite-type tricarboxylate transporter receptor subunit TctC
LAIGFLKHANLNRKEIIKMKEDIQKKAIRKLSSRERIACKRCVLITMLIIGLLGWNQGVKAEEYPAKPITMLISVMPGGIVDICGRMLAQEAKKILGQDVVVINKPGGGGAVAMGILANTKSDGYTILAHNSSTLSAAPHLESLPYDSLGDIVPIIQFGVTITMFGTQPDRPFKSFKDIIEFAQSNPGKVSCSVPGIGNTPHLVMELLNMEKNLKIPIILTEGTPKLIADLLGGHVTFCGTSVSGMMPYIKAGKVRPLVVSADQRIPVLPDVPTFIELGYLDEAFVEMYMISGPKGMSPAVIKKLEEAFKKAMETSEFRNLVGNFYLSVKDPLTGERIKEAVQKEYTRNGEIIRRAKLGRYGK